MNNQENPGRLTKAEGIEPQAIKAHWESGRETATPRAGAANRLENGSRRLFYINLDDWIWWAWTITAVLLLFGLSGYNSAILGAMVVTLGQGIVLFWRDRSPFAYSVQLRAAYLLLLLVCYPRGMRWLYWLPAGGTVALSAFGYCLMTRFLSLLPWNSAETYTWDRLRRTFLSAPDLERLKTDPAAAGCAGGLCTIAAQVPPPDRLAEPDNAANGHQPIHTTTNRTPSAAGFRR